MIKSMTGFGRGNYEESGRSFVIEIKSVNHRYLDVNVKMPRAMISLEERIRKAISETISRGKIDVFVTQNNYEKEDMVASFNEHLADSYVKCLQEIKERYSVRDDISVSLIAKFPDVISLQKDEQDLEDIWKTAEVPLKMAIEALVSMREREGEKLKEDIVTRCNNVAELVKKVELRAPLVVKEYKERLEQRLKDLLNDAVIDENRIAMEIAIFADRSNIDEEIVRLKSHLAQMIDNTKLEEPVGRKLDFILQELNRETNTIGSKANDAELVQIVLNMKNEIEKIREQVQNIE